MTATLVHRAAWLVLLCVIVFTLCTATASSQESFHQDSIAISWSKVRTSYANRQQSPAFPSGVIGYAAVAANDSIFVLGGEQSSWVGKTSSPVLMLDSEFVWKTFAVPQLSRVVDGCAFNLHNHIYYLGGMQRSVFGAVAFTSPLQFHYTSGELHTRTVQWSDSRDPVIPRHHHTCSVVSSSSSSSAASDSLVWVVGGQCHTGPCTGDNFVRVLRQDVSGLCGEQPCFVTEVPTLMEPHPPVQQHSATVFQEQIYIFGGVGTADGNVAALDAVWRLDTSTYRQDRTRPLTWHALAPAPLPLLQHTAFPLSSWMLVHGGLTGTSSSDRVNAQTLLYDSALNEWQIVMEAGLRPHRLHGHASVQLRGSTYVVLDHLADFALFACSASDDELLAATSLSSNRSYSSSADIPSLQEWESVWASVQSKLSSSLHSLHEEKDLLGKAAGKSGGSGSGGAATASGSKPWAPLSAASLHQLVEQVRIYNSRKTELLENERKLAEFEQRIQSATGHVREILSSAQSTKQEVERLYQEAVELLATYNALISNTSEYHQSVQTLQDQQVMIHRRVEKYEASHQAAKLELEQVSSTLDRMQKSLELREREVNQLGKTVKLSQEELDTLAPQVKEMNQSIEVEEHTALRKARQLSKLYDIRKASESISGESNSLARLYQDVEEFEKFRALTDSVLEEEDSDDISADLNNLRAVQSELYAQIQQKRTKTLTQLESRIEALERECDQHRGTVKELRKQFSPLQYRFDQLTASLREARTRLAQEQQQMEATNESMQAALAKKEKLLAEVQSSFERFHEQRTSLNSVVQQLELLKESHSSLKEREQSMLAAYRERSKEYTKEREQLVELVKTAESLEKSHSFAQLSHEIRKILEGREANAAAVAHESRKLVQLVQQSQVELTQLLSAVGESSS